MLNMKCFKINMIIDVTTYYLNRKDSFIRIEVMCNRELQPKCGAQEYKAVAFKLTVDMNVSQVFYGPQ